MKVLVALGATLILITAAALSATSPVAAQSTGRACFWPRSIQGFRSVDNRTVYVRAAGRDNVFALDLFAPCLGVDWAHSAALRSRTGGTICEGRGNSVEIYVRSAGRSRQRCPVTNVRRLTPEELGALPPRARP